VLLTADQGGHGWSHGSSDPRDVTIPWIAWGEGVRAGTRVPNGVRTMDTAATALWLLGLPALGVGQPVQTAFQPGQRAEQVRSLSVKPAACQTA
jgi:arylsulfatase A-like enzyme